MLSIEMAISLLMLGCWATVFARAARTEDVPPFAWAGLSVIVFSITWLGFGWGWLMCNLTQVVLFVAVGVAKGLWKEFGHKWKRKRRKKRKPASTSRNP